MRASAHNAKPSIQGSCTIKNEKLNFYYQVGNL
jgi:hypothetical protein